MVTPKEAETLAHKTVQEYVNACGCNSTEDVSNVLMKLVSMCGLAMCATVGQRETIDRLIGTADYIRTTQSGVNWKMEKEH